MGRRRPAWPRRAVAATALAAVPWATAAESPASSPSASSTGPLPTSEARARSPWHAQDPVEVYYAEFLLAQWVLDKAPWNAYHSALAFKNNRTGEKALFDYTPDDVSSVMNMVLPDVRYDSDVGAMLGDYELIWRDRAHTEFYPYWPDSYSNFILLGATNGSVFGRFADWVEAEYTPKYTSFQPVEVAAVGKARASGATTVVRSRMCHDFVTDALWVLYRDGVTLKAEEAIFRDHIILYAEAAEKLGSVGARDRRKWLRYLRTVNLFLEAIKLQFTYGRDALVAGFKMGITLFMRSEHVDYKVKLVPPFLNYCYLPLAMPPEVHDPLGTTKLCALAMQANMTNTTAPWPWGAMISAEERLDRPEIALSGLLVALAALVWGSAAPSAGAGADAARKGKAA